MSINPIEFQPGLSKLKFLNSSGTEAQSKAELKQARRTQGFVSLCCAHTGHVVFKGGSHKTFRCHACRHQISLIAATVFQRTRLTITVWFLAIDLIIQYETGLTALSLKQSPGVSYPTVRLIKNRLKVPDYKTTPPSWLPSASDIAWIADSVHLKPHDNQK